MRQLDKMLKPALVVIDMQNYFVHPDGGAFIPETQVILPNILTLVDTFRRAHLPVIYTRHAHNDLKDAGQMGVWWDDLPMEGTFDSRLIDELSPKKEELVIRKEKYSAFSEKSLLRKLQSLKIKELVLCGVMTHICVETTARDAFMNDFQPIVVMDGCASNSEELHLAALKTLAHCCSIVTTCNDIVSKLR